MKKLALISLLSFAAFSCQARPGTQPAATQSPAELFRLAKVNVVQSALAPAPATFDRWNALYRNHKQQIEQFVAHNTLTQEEIKIADTLLQEMDTEWVIRVKAKYESTQHAKLQA